MISDDYTVAQKLSAMLVSREWRVTVAESCTGGGVAQALTAVAGSSAWFELGLVTYSNRMKSALLGVPEALLKQHGAVSEEVAKAMLSGAFAQSQADLGLSVSGIAGPGGGTSAKPVGTVCFAWGCPDNIRSETCLFSGDRQAVRKQSVLAGLHKLLHFASR